MTYCLEHPSRKMLLMPVEPFEPNKSCYVCSETPLLLEVNTSTTKLRDFVEKIVTKRLGMNFPLVMHGANLIFEVGDDLEEDVAANYALNLDKVLAELPTPVTNGTMLTVEDLQQEFSCNINIKHREDFDEEKEPDRMLLSGWTAPSDKDGSLTRNGESTSTGGLETLDEVDVASKKHGVITGTKRKLSEVAELTQTTDSKHNATRHEAPEDVGDDDDDVVVMLNESPETGRKKRLK